MSKYVHTTKVHNLTDPEIIVPEIVKLFNPKSVVDIGCGLGTFVSVFKANGVKEVLGVDGPWTNRELLYKNIKEEEFLEYDLEKEITLDKEYDMVISLEVAEHLSGTAAETFAKSLVNAGKLIIFSAAIPQQGGQNHINEQWITYWEEKFNKLGYVVQDVIRPIFWYNSDICWWYRQNMILVTPKDYQITFEAQEIPMRNIVHYQLFEDRSKELAELRAGKESPTKYFKWFFVSLFWSLVKLGQVLSGKRKIKWT